MTKDTFSLRRLVIAGWFGTLLEWYDFSVYGFLAPIIAVNFFPSGHHWIQLLLAYSIFSMGYLVRPLGGLFFGSLGDRRGRKSVFIYTILCMSLPTVLIGILPTYQMLGWLAPVMLLGLRLLQGLAAGGEMIGAVTYIYESSPAHRKAFYTALLFVGSGFGILLGSAVLSLLHHFYSEKVMREFMWRVPFLLAVLGLVISVWLRHNVQESEAFIRSQRAGLNLTRPFLEVIKYHKVTVLRVAALFSPGALLFYLNFVFLPASLSPMTGVPQKTVMLLNTLATFILLVSSVGFAWLADRFSERNMLFIALSLLLMLSIPLYASISLLSMGLWFSLQIILAVIIALLTGPLMAFTLHQSSVEVRYSSMAIAYNLAYSLIGGTAPVIAVSLLHGHSDHWWLGVYAAVVISTALVSLFASPHSRLSR